jgi:signal transduction histidine kinase
MEKKLLSLCDIDEDWSRRVQRPDRDLVDHRGTTAIEHVATIPAARLLRFVRTMAHDFRHHLCALYASSEFLSMQCRDPSEGSDLLMDIRLAMDCITDQLESLLLFAKTGHAFCPRPQALAPLVEKAVRMIRPHADAYAVSIRCQIQTRAHGCVDEQRLGSAIFNLILNACQAAAAGALLGHREVVIALDNAGGNVFVRITDNGPGVPAEMRDNLFRHFMWTGKNRETGLGLAIAKCAAQEHGGDVYLELSHPGKTVFILKLPGNAA